ncbi:TerC family protein [Parvularcula sp. IMCC14364]|uniref:TerC family protein n=1 Tax=Parvularcula sp. IMCC14364 TaxID=3067902 RepID=UPI0027403770|nr:tellurium resistance protein TerC [Parvularcula sp. IMCC14364]
MADLFTPENLFTLIMLILLQAVLGFDNLLYISIESRRVPQEHQRRVRQLGIGLAIGLRLILLFVVMAAIESLKEPFFSIDWGFIKGAFTFHAVVTLFGGAFILYTAMKEIFHLLSVDHLEHADSAGKRSVAGAIFWIVTMNLVFSFDSILSSIALTNVFAIMAVAIISVGIMMIWLSDHVSNFLEQNRAYEVLGLFVLFIVGVLLVSESGHLAHLYLFGYEVTAMSKTTFYFVIFVMVCVSVVQTKYRNKLLAAREAAVRDGTPTMEPETAFPASDAEDGIKRTPPSSAKH